MPGAAGPCSKRCPSSALDAEDLGGMQGLGGPEQTSAHALHHSPTPELGTRQPGSACCAEAEPPPCLNYPGIGQGREKTLEGSAWQHIPCSQGVCASPITCLAPAVVGHRQSLCPDPAGLCFYSDTVHREWSTCWTCRPW